MKLSTQRVFKMRSVTSCLLLIIESNFLPLLITFRCMTPALIIYTRICIELVDHYWVTSVIFSTILNRAGQVEFPDFIISDWWLLYWCYTVTCAEIHESILRKVCFHCRLIVLNFPKNRPIFVKIVIKSCRNLQILTDFFWN